MRRTLDSLAVKQLSNAHQGRCTVIAAHAQDRALPRFFRRSSAEGAGVSPTSASKTLRRRVARGPDARRPGLVAGPPIVEIDRTRRVDAVPKTLQGRVAPGAPFPDLERCSPLPNALYPHRDGQNIVAAVDRLNDEAAGKQDARRLGVLPGTPLRLIDCIAIGVDGAQVDWRVSRCDTRRLNYAVTLTGGTRTAAAAARPKRTVLAVRLRFAVARR